jgi:hypothetical protein
MATSLKCVFVLYVLQMATDAAVLTKRQNYFPTGSPGIPYGSYPPENTDQQNLNQHNQFMPQQNLNQQNPYPNGNQQNPYPNGNQLDPYMQNGNQLDPYMQNTNQQNGFGPSTYGQRPY